MDLPITHLTAEGDGVLDIEIKKQGDIYYLNNSPYSPSYAVAPRGVNIPNKNG